MRCRECQWENDDTLLFCAQCGKPLFEDGRYDETPKVTGLLVEPPDAPIDGTPLTESAANDSKPKPTTPVDPDAEAKKRAKNTRSILAVGLLLMATVAIIAALTLSQYYQPAERKMASDEYKAADLEIAKQSEGLNAYSLLDEQDQQYYRGLVLAAQGNEVSVEPYDAVPNTDDRQRIYKYVYADYPWLLNAPSRAKSEEAYAEFMKGYENDAKKCLKGISKKASDYEKSKYVYEWLANNTVFDKQPEHGNYAQRYTYLMRKLGVPCSYVTGHLTEEECKKRGKEVEDSFLSWCLVKLDGEYYFTDPGWGDNDIGENPDEWHAALGEVNYGFLNVTSEILGITHVADDKYVIKPPECTATTDNYFVKEGAYYETADTDRLAATFGGLELGKMYILGCANKETFAALDDFVGNNGFQNHAQQYSFTVYQYARFPDEKALVIYILRKQ